MKRVPRQGTDWYALATVASQRKVVALLDVGARLGRDHRLVEDVDKMVLTDPS